MRRYISKIFSKISYQKVMAIYFIICLAMVSFPGILFANRIHPYILGMPFLLFWSILWSLVIIPAGLIYLYIKEEVKRSRRSRK